MTRLDGELVGLREFEAADAAGLHRVYGDPTVTEHLSFSPRDLDAVGSLVAGFVEEAVASPRTVYSLAVVESGREELIGSARLGIENAHSGVIGFAVRADQWGKGYGSETARLLLALGFDHLGLYRMWGGRSPLNAASERVMTTIGMREEGVIRAHINKDGRWRDSVSHSILLPEWREQHGDGQWYRIEGAPNGSGS